MEYYYAYDLTSISRMEQYFKLAIMLVLLTAFCQGQHHLPAGPVRPRVLELEKTVEQLLQRLEELQTARTESDVGPTVVKRGFMYSGLSPYIVDGFTVDRSAAGDEVGFHVSLTDDVKLMFEKKIHFDTIAENIGGAYNKGNAEFFCPVSGTYLISLNIACQKDTYVEVSVKISNEFYPPRYVLNTVCDQRKRILSGGGSLYCGSTQNGGTAIVSLRQGDKASIEKIWPVNGESIILGKGFSTFSGYLLRPS